MEQISGLGPFTGSANPRGTPATTPVSSPAGVPFGDPSGGHHHSGATYAGQDESRSATGSVRSRVSVAAHPGHHAQHPPRIRHSSSGEVSFRTSDSWGLPRGKKVERSRSDGNLTRRLRLGTGKVRTKRYEHVAIPSKSRFSYSSLIAGDVPSCRIPSLRSGWLCNRNSVHLK